MLAKQRLKNGLLAYNLKQFNLEKLQDAFDSAKEMGLQPEDYIFKTAECLLISTQKTADERIGNFVLDDETSITFKILDCGGQEVFIYV